MTAWYGLEPLYWIMCGTGNECGKRLCHEELRQTAAATALHAPHPSSRPVIDAKRNTLVLTALTRNISVLFSVRTHSHVHAIKWSEEQRDIWYVLLPYIMHRTVHINTWLLFILLFCLLSSLIPLHTMSVSSSFAVSLLYDNPEYTDT